MSEYNFSYTIMLLPLVCVENQKSSENLSLKVCYFLFNNMVAMFQKSSAMSGKVVAMFGKVCYMNLMKNKADIYIKGIHILCLNLKKKADKDKK